MRLDDGLYKIVQQRYNESWESFINRAKKICKTVSKPESITRFLDYRQFSSLEYLDRKNLRLRAIQNPEGIYENFPWIENDGSLSLKTVNLVRVQQMQFPQIEIIYPLLDIPLNWIFGRWNRINPPTGEPYCECNSAQIRPDISIFKGKKHKKQHNKGSNSALAMMEEKTLCPFANSRFKCIYK